MVKPIFIMAAIATLALGCAKGKHTCNLTIDYPEQYILFKGFSETDLETIIVNRYQKYTNYTTLLSSDTVSPLQITVSGDTAFQNNNDPLNMGFHNIVRNYDYTVNVSGHLYQIAPVDTGSTSLSWEQTASCPDNKQTASFGATVNDQFTLPVTVSSSNYFILAK